MTAPRPETATEAGRPSIGEQVRSARIQMRITGRELARRAGLTPSYLHDIEKDRRVPSDAVWRSIAAQVPLHPDAIRAERASELRRRYPDTVAAIEAQARAPLVEALGRIAAWSVHARTQLRGTMRLIYEEAMRVVPYALDAPGPDAAPAPPRETADGGLTDPNRERCTCTGWPWCYTPHVHYSRINGVPTVCGSHDHDPALAGPIPAADAAGDGEPPEPVL